MKDTTDQKIVELERKINELYGSKEKGLGKMYRAYFSQFEKQDKEMSEKVKRGELTEKEYKAWRIATMMTGRKWNEFVKSVVAVICETNKQAAELLNGSLADVYVDNYNFVGKDIERQVNAL